MANLHHLKILARGVTEWNRWRDECGNERDHLDLGGAILNNVDLSVANLRNAVLRKAKLSGAIFNHAVLNDANLSVADLSDAQLDHADLSFANFSYADLSSANLSFANLQSTNLSHASLKNVNFNRARLGQTIFGGSDLSESKNLDAAIHFGPSIIDIGAVCASQGQVSDAFLRNCGLPEEIIDAAFALRSGPPIQWHSSFISYSTKDEEFARRLHSRMREANMRVWFAPEDLKGGEKLHEQLFEAIQIHDRLLIALSEHSIQSEWVMTEIRKARGVEKKEKHRKLFPIRLCDMATLQKWTCFDADSGKDLAVEVREYYIPDFSNWKDHDAFESAFARLKKDLEAENS